MLMILAVSGLCGQRRSADAHDAGCFVAAKEGAADAHDAGCFEPWRPKYAQLMLMMLAVWGLRGQRRSADAHDAGCFGPLRPKYAQLMLMMLAVSGLGGQSTPS